MKAVLAFVLGDDARLAVGAIVALIVMWAFADIPVMWLLFPAAISASLVVSVLRSQSD